MLRSVGSTPNQLSVLTHLTPAGQSLPNLSAEAAQQLSVPAGRAQLQPAQRGVTYPPLSPRTLRRGTAVQPPPRNPPLARARHVTTDGGCPSPPPPAPPPPPPPPPPAPASEIGGCRDPDVGTRTSGEQRYLCGCYQDRYRVSDVCECSYSAGQVRVETPVSLYILLSPRGGIHSAKWSVPVVTAVLGRMDCSDGLCLFLVSLLNGGSCGALYGRSGPVTNRVVHDVTNDDRQLVVGKRT